MSLLVTQDVTLTYTNERGLSLSTAIMNPYFLTGVKDSFDNQINSVKQGSLDGESFVSSSLAIRHFVINGFINSTSNKPQMRRQLERVFNMTMPGTLIYENSRTGVRREIDCRVESLPEMVFDGSNVTFSVSLAALYPLWRGPSVSGSISYINKLAHFPLVIPQNNFVFGYRAGRLENVIENIGDAPTGVRIKFTAASGTVKNPLVTHQESGRSVHVIVEMSRGDIVEIISLPDYSGVRVNGAEGIQFLTDETARHFFSLLPGRNTLGYGADLNVANLDVSFNYVDLYLGV